MRLDKLVKLSNKHAEMMYTIVLEKHNADKERFLKGLSKKVSTRKWGYKMAKILLPMVKERK